MTLVIINRYFLVGHRYIPAKLHKAPPAAAADYVINRDVILPLFSLFQTGVLKMKY